MSDVNPKPVWFITGCSTGFGRALAMSVLKQGFRLVATALDASTIQDLVAGHEEAALAVTLDVTDPAAITLAVRLAEEKFGRVDVLVNNAGFGYLAALEEGEDPVVRTMFDTNVFGLINMTKAVLPGMRARRQGHIVNMSSIAGLVSFAGVGYYHATKFAVEGLSTALAAELAPLNIKLIIVEPGPFRTEFSGASIRQTQTPISDYAETAGARRIREIEMSGKQPGDPAQAAKAIIDAVALSDPPLRLLLGKRAFELAMQDLETKREVFERWKLVTFSADYPT